VLDFTHIREVIRKIKISIRV